MRTNRDDLKLGELEMLTPPRDVWPEVEKVLDRRSNGFKPYLMPAAAALLVLSLGAITLLTGRVEQADSELAQWIEYSQQLEDRLRSLESSRVSYRGHEAIAVSELRDMVAIVDSALAESRAAPQTLELWQRRALLLDDLYAVQANALAQRYQGQPQPVVTQTVPVTLAAWEEPRRASQN